MGINQLLYHITHVTNLPSILDQGGLQSQLSIQQHELQYDVANQDVQSRRKKKRTSGGKGATYMTMYHFTLHRDRLCCTTYTSSS